MPTKVFALLTSLFMLSSCHFVTNAPKEKPTLSPAPSPSQSQTASVSPTTSPMPSESASPTVTPVLRNRTVALYYSAQTQDGLRLFREFRAIRSTADVGLSSLRYLVSNGQKPLDPDYQNFWGNGSIIHYINYVGNRAVVDLSVVPLEIDAQAEQRAIDQLVWTLTANHPATKFVKFTSSGKTFQSFSGFVDATRTFSRQLHYEVLGSVWVDQLRSVMTNPVTVKGTACTFEAGVHWMLIRDGNVIREDHTMAAGACPMRGAWSVSLGSLRPGKYIFIAQDISPKDGQAVQEDSKEFQIK